MDRGILKNSIRYRQSLLFRRFTARNNQREKKKSTSVLEGERPGLGNRQGRFAETAMSGEQEVSKETHFNRRLPLVLRGIIKWTVEYTLASKLFGLLIYGR